MLLRSASSPLLNCARAPAEHVAVGGGCHHPAVVSPSAAAARQGAPLVPAVRGRKKDEGGHGYYGRAPAPLVSLSSSASVSIEEEEEDVVAGAAAPLPVPVRRLLTSTGLESSPLGAAAVREAVAAASALLEEGVGGDGCGRKTCGTGGQGGDGNGRGAADAHYRRMIESDPGNSLLLVNYARFLKEVKRDAARAQEYCERANPGDADALALYAGLVWEASRDAGRAGAYYSRAVQAAPDDCYVLGSYAGFLWDAEEEDDEEDDSAERPPPSQFLGAAQPPSITAAS